MGGIKADRSLKEYIHNFVRWKLMFCNELRETFSFPFIRRLPGTSSLCRLANILHELCRRWIPEKYPIYASSHVRFWQIGRFITQIDESTGQIESVDWFMSMVEAEFSDRHK
jgi:hypothetical protein